MASKSHTHSFVSSPATEPLSLARAIRISGIPLVTFVPEALSKMRLYLDHIGVDGRPMWYKYPMGHVSIKTKERAARQSKAKQSFTQTGNSGRIRHPQRCISIVRPDLWLAWDVWLSLNASLPPRAVLSFASSHLPHSMSDASTTDRHEEFWFEDGNLILLVCHSQLMLVAAQPEGQPRSTTCTSRCTGRFLRARRDYSRTCLPSPRSKTLQRATLSRIL